MALGYVQIEPFTGEIILCRAKRITSLRYDIAFVMKFYFHEYQIT